MDVQQLARSVADLRLETHRLVLRSFRPSDTETAVAHELDRRIMCYVRDDQSEAEVRERVARYFEAFSGSDGEWTGLVIERRDREGMIGVAAFRVLSAENETVEIGYRLHPDEQRQGFALEACERLLGFLFEQADVRRITATCVPENHASYRLMEKLGMQREGRFREYSRLGGEWVDEFFYGILASDWRRRHSSEAPPSGAAT